MQESAGITGTGTASDAGSLRGNNLRAIPSRPCSGAEPTPKAPATASLRRSRGRSRDPDSARCWPPLPFALTWAHGACRPILLALQLSAPAGHFAAGGQRGRLGAAICRDLLFQNLLYSKAEHLWNSAVKATHCPELCMKTTKVPWKGRYCWNSAFKAAQSPELCI